MSSKRGFTLIELLVVIAIIAILAAILFPVFAKAREKARQSTCASNEKQLGLGLQQYTQDYDERLPPRVATTPGGSTLEAQSWRAGLQPYVKNRQILICPSNSTSTQTCNDGYPRSYGCNGMDAAATPMRVINLGGGVALAQLDTPAQMVLLGESNMYFAELTIDNGDNLWCRHNNMANFAYADGHVKVSKWAATGTPNNMWLVGGLNTPSPTWLTNALAKADAQGS